MSLDIRLEINGDEVHWQNITHNLNRMANEAGFYQQLWRPDEVGITKAKQLIGPIENGLIEMIKNWDRFTIFNASNGWGTYDQFLPWLAELLSNLKQFPEADISVSI